MRKTKRASHVERDEEPRAGALPLFPDVEGVDHLIVYRLEPQEDEGYLGQAEPTITEDGFRAKYGGGKFKITPRDGSSQYITGKGTRTFVIAGEPKWSNDIARRKYMKANGVEDTRAAAPAGERPPSIMEMMMFLQKQSESARLEMQAAAAVREREAELSRQQREREAEAAHKRQLELVQLQVQVQTDSLKAEQQRLREERKEQQERDREWMAAMAAHKGTQGGGDTLGQAAKLLELMQSLGGGGGGEEDPMANLTRNLPAIMQQLRLMSPGAAPAAGAKRPAGPEPLTIEGPLGAEANKVFGEIAKRGGDPSAVFAQVLQHLSRKLAAAPAPAATNGKAQPKGAATAPAPPAATPPRKTARPKTTARPKAATR